MSFEIDLIVMNNRHDRLGVFFLVVKHNNYTHYDPLWYIDASTGTTHSDSIFH